jgi:ribA/ribD-fused uncharacterized protein
MGFEFSGFLMINSFKGEYHFLSNFFPCEVLHRGITFISAEHAFQAAKARDEEERLWVASAPTPGNAKYRGKRVTIRPDWDTIKLQEMFTVVENKFSQPYLMQALMDTEMQPLVEGNYWHDQFWGSCMCPQHVNSEGKNYLGRILTYLRKHADLSK